MIYLSDFRVIDAPTFDEIEELYKLAYEGNKAITEFDESPSYTKNYLDGYRAGNEFLTPFAELKDRVTERYSEWDRRYGTTLVGSENPQTILEVVNNKRAEGIDFLWEHGFDDPTDLESELGWLDSYLQSLYNLQDDDGTTQKGIYQDMEVDPEDVSKEVMDFLHDIQALFENEDTDDAIEF